MIFNGYVYDTYIAVYIASGLVIYEYSFHIKVHYHLIKGSNKHDILAPCMTHGENFAYYKQGLCLSFMFYALA